MLLIFRLPLSIILFTIKSLFEGGKKALTCAFAKVWKYIDIPQYCFIQFYYMTADTT